MTHIAPAIRLAPNKHNKQRRKYIPLSSVLYKWKLKKYLYITTNNKEANQQVNKLINYLFYSYINATLLDSYLLHVYNLTFYIVE